MANYSWISKHCPFWFVPNTATPGIHFDDDWSCTQIKSFEANAYYIQKWLTATTTKIQCISTVAPQSLKIYNSSQQIAKAISWTVVATSSGANVYELTFDISDLPEGYYWLYQKFELLSYLAEFISEAIYSKASHPFVKPITYSHSDNDHDMVWTTNIEMVFCVEYEIMEYDFKAERNNTIDQTRDQFLLNGVPYRTCKLEVGTAKGVSPYIIDILNRIFCCDSVDLKGKKFAAKDGSEIEVRRVKNYPLIGATLEMVESNNLYSTQRNDLSALAPGLVTAYNIDTSFFGLGTIVPITEIDLE